MATLRPGRASGFFARKASLVVRLREPSTMVAISSSLSLFWKSEMHSKGLELYAWRGPGFHLRGNSRHASRRTQQLAILKKPQRLSSMVVGRHTPWIQVCVHTALFSGCTH